MKKLFTCSIAFFCLSIWSVNLFGQWQLTGNNDATNSSFLGTTNAFPLKFYTKNIQRLLIDTLGRVSIGNGSPRQLFTVQSSGGLPATSWITSGNPVYVGYGEGAAGNADFNVMMASTLANGRGVLGLKRSRGSLAAPAAVINNDQLGSLLVSGFDGSSFQGSAAVDFFADGTPSSGNVPARISFVTGTNGSNRTERMRIGNSGDITINTNQLFVQRATGNIGMGTILPTSRLDVNGIIRVGNVAGGFNPANGMIRFDGTDFFGYNNGWRSLTGGNFKAGSGITFSGDSIKTIPQTLSIAGDQLSLSGGGGTVTIPSGGGGSGGNWTLDGSNNIKNSNTGKVFMGDATGTYNARIEAADNTVFGKVMSVSNGSSSYMTVLDVKENGTSGGPKGCLNCTGNTAINVAANFGDAMFATSNSRGIYLKAGAPNFYPAMVIENNTGVNTSLDLGGQIQIRGGNPGAGKVLTSDASGLATWENAGGGGGWGLTGNAGTNAATNFIGTTDAANLVLKSNNYEALRIYNGGAIVATGNSTIGVTPVSGSGSRMMWIPGKQAFRSGSVLNTQWDDANIGFNSSAMGYNPIASGNTSLAFGQSIIASGDNSVALGSDVSTNSQAGAFCFGDRNSGNVMTASATNQMSMRFQGGYRLFTNSAASVGAVMAAGGNSWASVSDKRKKENFAEVNGEDFLAKISTFKLTSWNYIGQDAKIFRHYGPMAQDFFAAFGKDEFGVIGNDTTIASADFDGVNFIAIQALEKRTNALKIENEQLKAKNEQQAISFQKQIDELKDALLKMVNQQKCIPTTSK